jgi:predicted transposase YdaD
MGVNAKYKDSVFTFLFNDPALLRELYCALENVTLPEDIPITINTLKNILYMNRVNDLSFEISGKIVVLIEHQSTINTNMAVRLLIHIAQIYDLIIQSKRIYGKKQILLPEPEFFVLYNGDAPYPDESVLRLSDSFEKRADLGLPWKKAALELEVRVININEGRNEGLVGKCEKLLEYCAFIGKMKEFQKKKKNLERAARMTVEYCIQHDILKEFLEKHAMEVVKMLRAKWKMKDVITAWYEDGLEEGIEKGIEEGVEKVARNALENGLSIELIHTLTGLDEDAIKNLQESDNL